MYMYMYIHVYIHTIPIFAGSRLNLLLWSREWTMRVCVLVPVLVSTLCLRAAFSEVPCPPWFESDSNSNGSSPQCIRGHYVPFMIECVQREYTSYLMLGYCVLYV